MTGISSTRLVWKNPVIAKEVRTRMRGGRAFILITAHLFILVSAVVLAYLFYRSALTSTANLEARRIFGKAVFGLIVWVELTMVSFVAPALTSGAISIERERQTLDLLKVTPLSAGSLVLGKYFSGMLFLFLLLFTSIPIQSQSFLIGGVLPQEVFIAVSILAVTAIQFSALGMLISSLFKRTTLSMAITYGISVTTVYAIPIIGIIILFMFGSGTSGDFFDQLSATGQVLLILFGWIVVCLTPLTTIIGTEVILLDQQSLVFARIPLENGASLILPSPWVVYLLSHLGFSLLALWLSIELVKHRDP